MAVRLPMTHLAVSMDAPAFALYGANAIGPSVSIGSDVNVLEGPNTNVFAQVANVGNGQVVLNPAADTGNVWSIGDVDLFSGTTTQPTTVHGDLRTSGVANIPPVGAVVTGSVFQLATIGLGTTTITATFPTPAPADIVHNTPSTLSLVPGAYGNVVVDLGTLALSPGTYTFESLTMNAGSQLIANNAASVVRVNVRTQMVFRASTTAATNPANLRFAVFGAGGASLGAGSTTTIFRGTVVALNGPLIIEGTRTYRGAFFGLTVTVLTGATIQHQAFSAWETPS
jgi:hypothetical protein